MKCSIDSTGLCVSHGVQMHPDFAEMQGSVCPVGHIVEVERRFDFMAKDLALTVYRLQGMNHLLRERLEVIEEKLGIERPSEFWGEEDSE